MNLVEIKNGQVLTDSLTVSTAFGKQHKNVIRDIEVLIANMKVLEEVGNDLTQSKIGQGTQLNFEQGYSDQQIQRFFIESRYYHPKNKQEHKMYLMTRDGFSLLVMGFTGQKALEWKLKYIEAFNYMENTIKQVQKIDITNSREWKLLKGSVRSLLTLREKLEKDIRVIEDNKVQIGLYSRQIERLTKEIESKVE